MPHPDVTKHYETERARIDAATAAHAEIEQYQGWANRETWALTLHINNDQGLYEEFRDLARDEAWSSGYDRDKAIRERVTELLDIDYWTEEGADYPPAIAMMAREIGSLWRVDWAEVTAALLED